MIQSPRRLSVLALAVLMTATSAHAATFAFSYTFAATTGETISGTLDGDLQPDGMTVSVNEILSAVYSGDPALVFDLTPPAPGTQFATFSGANTFIAGGAQPDPAFAIGFLGTQAVVGGPGGSIIELEGNNPDDFSLSAVPEPAGLVLIGIAWFVVRTQRRRAAA